VIKMERACRVCKSLGDEKECVVCKSKDLTTNWKGIVIIFDADSELAKSTGHETSGKYALQVM
jgi:RNA polymerase subunit RPABC4/transcription elongation factor Spt4